LYNLDADGGLVVTTSIPVLLKGKRTSVAVADGQPCPAIVNPNHNDWTFAKIALSADDETLLSEHLGNVADPLSRSMFLAGLSDKAMRDREKLCRARADLNCAHRSSGHDAALAT
jgi:hypothetical protein